MSWTIRVCSSNFAKRVNVEVNTEVITKVKTTSVTANLCHTLVQLAAKPQTGSASQNDGERIAQKIVLALLG